jgi:hypothetical protein
MKYNDDASSGREEISAGHSDAETDRFNDGALVNEIADEITECLAQPYDDDDDDVDTRYEREILIHFPPEASIVHNVEYIAIPIRNVLTWFGEAHPEDAERLLRLRDDFYGGDDDLDYGHEVEHSHIFVSPQVQAEITLNRQRTLPKRLKARAEIEAEMRSEEKSHTILWEPFLKERRAVEERHKRLCALRDAYDAEWLCLASAVEEIAAKPRLAERAVELELREKALELEMTRNQEKWGELLREVERHGHREPFSLRH